MSFGVKIPSGGEMNGVQVVLSKAEVFEQLQTNNILKLDLYEDWSPSYPSENGEFSKTVSKRGNFWKRIVDDRGENAKCVSNKRNQEPRNEIGALLFLDGHVIWPRHAGSGYLRWNSSNAFSFFVNAITDGSSIEWILSQFSLSNRVNVCGRE